VGKKLHIPIRKIPAILDHGNHEPVDPARATPVKKIKARNRSEWTNFFMVISTSQFNGSSPSSHKKMLEYKTLIDPAQSYGRALLNPHVPQTAVDMQGIHVMFNGCSHSGHLLTNK